MKLHLNREEFDNLASLTGEYFHISSTNIKRDYYLVMMLFQLSQSEYIDKCVFKGGTSLSKCSKNAIKRFSEDIDLTLIPDNAYSNKTYDRTLKRIEAIMTTGFMIDKIDNERNSRNKSAWVWNENEDKETTKIKLEIGSNIIPFPYKKFEIRSYIQEYLESKGFIEDIKRFDLKSFSLNTLDIKRTFIDKIMAIKRHAIYGTLASKTRHIYDVASLFELDEIQSFLKSKKLLKEIVHRVKETDSFYLAKRKMNVIYNSLEKYNFQSWKNRIDSAVINNYLRLKEIIYDDSINLDINKAIDILNKISNLLAEIDE